MSSTSVGYHQTSSVTLSAGDTETVTSGGVATATIVSSGGFVAISSGGTADDTTISSGGTQVILAGGVAVGTTIDLGGGEFVSSGGTTISATVNSGGFETVSSGGTATAATVTGGGAFVLSGGTAASMDLADSGYQVVSFGGVAVSTVIGSGGFQLVSGGGTATATSVTSGGVELVLPGASVPGTQVSAGGVVVSTGVVVVSSGVPVAIDSGTVPGVVAAGSAQVYVLSGGVAAGATVTNSAFEYVYNGGTVSGGIIGAESNAIVFSGASATDFTVGAAAHIFVISGGTLDDAAVASGGSEVVFNGATATGTDLALGGAIDLADFTYLSSGGLAQVDPSDVLSFTHGHETYTQQLSGDYTSVYFQTSRDATGDTLITAETTPCFLRGTMILTVRGEVAVEALQPGDELVCWSGQRKAVTWVGMGRQRVTAANRGRAAPVVVRRGALAEDVPHRDLRVTAEHAMLVDGAMVVARALVNGRSILRDHAMDVVDYFHVEVAGHDVLVANGAPAESYRDDDNRAQFLLGVGAAPAGAGITAQAAPVLTDGPEAARRWRLLSDRAGGCAPLTRDPDLHLRADGVRIEMAALGDGLWQAVLSERPALLHLCARASVPAETGAEFDHRRLGVAVRQIVLSQGRRRLLLPARSSLLRDGFHAAEQDARWMDGDAALPLAELAGGTGPLRVRVDIAAVAPVPVREVQEKSHRKVFLKKLSRKVL